MWDLLYEKAGVKSSGIDKIKEVLIYIKNKSTKELKTFEIIEEIMKNSFFN